MNTLKLIRQTIRQWHNHCPPAKVSADRLKQYFPESNPQTKAVNTQPKWFRLCCKVHPPVMLLVTITSLTGIVSYRFYNQPELAVGTISPVRIEAPASGVFEDRETTEQLRKQTRTGVLPVLKQDLAATENINLGLVKLLSHVDKARNIAGDFPFLKPTILSSATQQYLRAAPPEKWQQIVNQSGLAATATEAHSRARAEIDKVRNKLKEPEFRGVIAQIENARQRYQESWQQLLNEPINSLSVPEKEKLIAIKAEDWQQIKQGIKIACRRIVTQGIPPGLPEDAIRKAAILQLGEGLSPSTQEIAIQILLQVLEPNLTINEMETKARAEKAMESVKPVLVSIEKGQVIVDVGERITQADFVLLDSFGLSRRSINWLGIGSCALLVFASTAVFLAIASQVRRKLRRRDQILLWLLSLTVPAIGIFDLHYTSLPAVGFLASSFYGPTLAVSNVSILTVLVLYGTEGGGWEYLLASYSGSLLASLFASRLHSREELALLGAGVGLTQGGTYLVINLILSAAAGTIWYAVLPGALWYGSMGLAYSVLALGISPYLERFFDLTTPIRLAELSNPNRPLLKRLALEAPGTFQHTMFVSSLAEAAARELHCNVELVRAGTLYHDIGKMHDPQGFIENQMGGPNKHDSIDDPWESAAIIKKHVSEGIAMARQYGLPQAIQDFIPQHQGTLLISYFYFQAKAKAEAGGGREVRDGDFRYDGPIPQSRETGIVMLADGCEAALRSLKDASPAQARAMVQKIFKARWREGQLADSGLKYEELPAIADVFIQVWQQFNHQRIAYPKAALAEAIN